MHQSTQAGEALAAYGELDEVACPLCRSGSNPLYVWAPSHYGPEKFRVTRCQNCSMIFTNPQPVTYTTEVAQRGVLDRHFRQQKSHGAAAWRPWGLSVLAPHIKGRRVWDFGCGEGAFVAEARADGWDAVERPDLNRGLVTRANEFWKFDALQPGSLDEFLATRPALLTRSSRRRCSSTAASIDIGRQLRGLLKPDGPLYIDVPNANQLMEWRRLGVTLDPTAHWNHFTVPTLRRLMAEMGFTVVTASGAPSLVNVFHRLRLGRVANRLGRMSRRWLPPIGSGVSCLRRRTAAA